jgi:hypothetical protein
LSQIKQKQKATKQKNKKKQTKTKSQFNLIEIQSPLSQACGITFVNIVQFLVALIFVRNPFYLLVNPDFNVSQSYYLNQIVS